MPRNRAILKMGLPVGSAVLFGVLLGAFLTVGAVGEAAQIQDPAITRLQQEVNNLRLVLTSKTDTMQVEIDRVERELQTLGFRVNTVEQARQQHSLTPAPQPVGGRTADVITAREFVLFDDDGNVVARLGPTDFGPGLTLLNASGAETAQLIATGGGAELWLRDTDGNLRALMSATDEKGGLVLLDRSGNSLFRRD